MRTDNRGHPYRIRPARPEDASPLTDLLREIAAVDGFILLTPEEVHEEPSSREQSLSAANRTGGAWVILVAEDESGVFGMVTLKAVPLRRCAHVCELGIGIRAEGRGRGVGRDLLRAALQEAVRQGFRKVRLMVIASNHRAIRLYRQEGFVETGRFQEEVRVGWGYEDLVVMERTLP
ncbi:MAG TPA: GNAT family N-acetyltransferase [Myxococcota bacterium]|nr:GNAT family N-acetyltransferase [Myxococcota bacterium]HQK50889.1 GNAT family N-acetyltransferase [Myxococcota bacterium]